MRNRNRPGSSMAPQIRKDYLSDPETLLAQQIMKTGSATTPVGSHAEGIARALTGALGGWSAHDTQSRYQKTSDEYSAALKDLIANREGKTPDELAAAMAASPNQYIRDMGQEAYGTMFAEQLKPRDPIKLGSGDTLYDQRTGKVLYTAPVNDSASRGGATGQIIRDYLANNPNATWNDAFYAVYGNGAKRDLTLDQNGNIVPMPGAGTARGDLKYGEESGNQRAKTEAELNAAAAKKNVLANDVIALTQQADALLDNASGSYGGAIEVAVRRALGNSTEKTQANAALEVIGGRLVAAMPRMEGPQSNYDVELYTKMAGRIADPTVPAGDKRAAIKELQALNEKYIKNAPTYPSANNPIDPLVAKAKAAGYSDEEIQQFLGGRQ